MFYVYLSDSIFGGIILALFMFIHGFGHLIAGYHFDIHLSMTFLGPFGVTETPVSKIDEKRLFASWPRQAFVAIGGPLLPLIIALGVSLLPVSTEARNALFLISVVHLLNLLPIYPLDGGRIVYAVITSIHKNVFYVAFVGSAILMFFLWDTFGRRPLTTVLYPIILLVGFGEGFMANRMNRIRTSVGGALCLTLIYGGLILSWGGLLYYNFTLL